LIPRAVLAALTGKKMPLQGNPSKSYLHADDLSAAIELLINEHTPGIFNVGADHPSSIHKIVEEIASQFEMWTGDIAEITEGRANEDACFWIDSTKIKKMGWKPTIELRQGMNEMAEWGKKYKDQLVNMSTDYLMMP
jgi:dTDP-glucose 4,6-dehydratase